MEILLKYRCTSLKKPHKTLQKDPGPLPMLCGSGSVLQCSLRLTWWLEEAPLPPLVLPLPPTAVALLRRACSWSNSKSSRRCVKASFCWMAIRNREFRVFFSSSAAASCLCMSSNWVTYSSHLRQKRGEKSRRERRGEKKKQEVHITSSRWSNLPWSATAVVTCFLHSPDSVFQMGGWGLCLWHQTVPRMLCAFFTNAYRHAHNSSFSE